MMKETQDVVIAICKLAVAVDKTVADALAGQTGIVKEIGNFIPVLIAVPSAIKDCAKIPDEIQNATDAEKAELVERAKQEIAPMPHDVAEAVIGQALEIALSFWQLVSKAAAARAA